MTSAVSYLRLKFIGKIWQPELFFTVFIFFTVMAARVLGGKAIASRIAWESIIEQTLILCL